MDSPLLEIVADWGTVASATVLLGFLLNQGYVFASRALRRIPRLADLPVRLPGDVKRVVVYVTAVVLTVSFADFSAVLPDGSEPTAYVSAVLAYSTTVFKFAQSIYTRIWERLIAA